MTTILYYRASNLLSRDENKLDQAYIEALCHQRPLDIGLQPQEGVVGVKPRFIMLALQIPPSPANRLLAALHRHAIYYLHTLMRHRRALDFSPSDASTPPPHHSHDPP